MLAAATNSQSKVEVSHGLSQPKNSAAPSWNQNHETDDDHGGDEEDRIVQVETEDADIVLADLVVGLGLNDCTHSSNSPMGTMNRSARRRRDPGGGHRCRHRR
jgi:hypothetical protein